MSPFRLTSFSLALCAALVGFDRSATAQISLALDGQTSLVAETGSTFDVTVSGAVGQQIFVLIDVLPGSVNFLGTVIPVSLTPALVVFDAGAIPASGTVTVELTVRNSPALHGSKFYFAALTPDAGQPSGLTASNGADVTLATRAQLAGQSRSNYPFFEVARSFHRGSTIQLGLDPRYEFANGQMADVYCVASRTATEWMANTTLTDARGAPVTLTFANSPTSIQQNTFLLDAGTLAGPDENASSGDTRIGVGYDVVIDFGRDGNFDEGVDLIDGYDEAEAGLYIVRDTVRGGRATATTLGPYAVTETIYSLGGAFSNQDTYYPTNIASLGQLPLVVVSHGNGHDYRWYDHIGYHLASYGYVVMSHQNNTVPGSHTAAVTTLDNTDDFLGNLATIQGGLLDGHVDADTIIWIGHSRGADGVARAYDQLFRGAVTPANYSIDDIKLVSSLAPVDFGGFEGVGPILGGTNNGSNPRDSNFHLWVAQADADVNGCADAGATHWYRLHERATDKRQSISIYGVGHADFHDGPTGSVASGPSLIGRATTHDIMRGYMLPLVKFHIEGDLPSKDFLWRQYESFRPVGAPTGANIVANLMFQGEASDEKYILDDFQDQAAVNPALATSGASVTVDVDNFLEGRMDDQNLSYTWSVTDPFNGFTYDDFSGDGRERSNSFACVFDFSGGGSRSITYDLTPVVTRPDFEDYEFLSFRAAQGTRHPLTTGMIGDVTFSVRLEDAAGNGASINIGVHGGGVEEPYQRNSGPSCGTGFGWSSEYETIRLRLTDFLNDGSNLNLSDVTKVVFEFGPAHGSSQGRLGLDEIELIKN